MLPNSIPLQSCRAYVSAQTRHHTRSPDEAPAYPAITLSRQAGARGTTIGHKLVEHLNRKLRPSEVPWSLFDKDLIRQVLDDHALPAELEKFIPESHISGLDGIIGEILGRHPSLWTLFEHVSQTVLRLTMMGRTVVVGRGANIIEPVPRS